MIEPRIKLSGFFLWYFRLLKIASALGSLVFALGFCHPNVRAYCIEVLWHEGLYLSELCLYLIAFYALLRWLGRPFPAESVSRIESDPRGIKVHHLHRRPKFFANGIFDLDDLRRQLAPFQISDLVEAKLQGLRSGEVMTITNWKLRGPVIFTFLVFGAFLSHFVWWAGLFPLGFLLFEFHQRSKLGFAGSISYRGCTLKSGEFIPWEEVTGPIYYGTRPGFMWNGKAVVLAESDYRDVLTVVGLVRRLTGARTCLIEVGGPWQRLYAGHATFVLGGEGLIDIVCNSKGRIINSDGIGNGLQEDNEGDGLMTTTPFIRW